MFNSASEVAALGQLPASGDEKYGTVVDLLRAAHSDDAHERPTAAEFASVLGSISAIE